MDIYQHFRKEEQPFIDQVLSWLDQVEKTYQSKLTDFLNPREQKIVDMLTGTSMMDLRVLKHGGSINAERQRVIIAPEYEEVTEDAFQLTLLQGTYHTKFVSLTHRDVMGAFLSIGLKRQKLGDIIVENGLVQIITAQEMAPFVLTNLTEIKHTHTRLSEKPLSSAVAGSGDWVTSDHIVTSLRLDTVVTAIYRLSRKTAADMIAKGYVKVNYQVIDDRKFSVDAGDMISIRGKGRSRLVSFNGYTKKDKVSITAAILK
ncbi:RNA-binding protein [Barrientosiimonas marina]|uniref:RNA-binding protein n=1 Tax=Lentibacillus kimchii TaxID=1542911 RepID=A0ABW2UPC9_9BACI